MLADEILKEKDKEEGTLAKTLASKKLKERQKTIEAHKKQAKVNDGAATPEV